MSLSLLSDRPWKEKLAQEHAASKVVTKSKWETKIEYVYAKDSAKAREGSSRTCMDATKNIAHACTATRAHARTHLGHREIDRVEGQPRLLLHDVHEGRKEEEAREALRRHQNHHHHHQQQQRISAHARAGLAQRASATRRAARDAPERGEGGAYIYNACGQMCASTTGGGREWRR